MKTTIQFFGQLTDITNTHSLEVNDFADTDGLIKNLQERYPGLASAKFTIALNNTLIQTNTALTGNNIIALMPPFSGG